MNVLGFLAIYSSIGENSKFSFRTCARAEFKYTRKLSMRGKRTRAKIERAYSALGLRQVWSKYTCSRFLSWRNQLINIYFLFFLFFHWIFLRIFHPRDVIYVSLLILKHPTKINKKLFFSFLILYHLGCLINIRIMMLLDIFILASISSTFPSAFLQFYQWNFFFPRHSLSSEAFSLPEFYDFAQLYCICSHHLQIHTLFQKLGFSNKKKIFLSHKHKHSNLNFFFLLILPFMSKT